MSNLESELAGPNLELRIEALGMKDGAHVIDRSPDGLTLLAIFEEGVLVRYEYQDEYGRAVPSISLRSRTGGGVKCFFCVQKGDTIVCKQVRCPGAAGGGGTQI